MVGTLTYFTAFGGDSRPIDRMDLDLGKACGEGVGAALGGESGVSLRRRRSFEFCQRW
jgi:hypothetical protein